MSEQKVTDELGVMTFNAATHTYETILKMSHVGSVRVSVAAEGFRSGVERMSVFLTWLDLNDRSFKRLLENEIQNYDLVWDDVWDSILGNSWVDAEEGFLGEYLTYESIEVYPGAIHVWVDTAGLHTDHKIRATISSAMQIENCELM
jgi:hypothetical protein